MRLQGWSRAGLKGSHWGAPRASGAVSETNPALLPNCQSTAGTGWESQPPPLGMPKQHIKEKKSAITFMFRFLSQMLL